MFIPIYLLIILGVLAAIGATIVAFVLLSCLVFWLDIDLDDPVPPRKPEQSRLVARHNGPADKNYDFRKSMRRL